MYVVNYRSTNIVQVYYAAHGGPLSTVTLAGNEALRGLYNSLVCSNTHLAPLAILVLYKFAVLYNCHHQTYT